MPIRTAGCKKSAIVSLKVVNKDRLAVAKQKVVRKAGIKDRLAPLKEKVVRKEGK